MCIILKMGVSSIRNSIFTVIKGYLFVGEQYNSWHLWYLLSSIYALIALRWLIAERNTCIMMLVVSITASIVSSFIDWVVDIGNNSQSAAIDMLLKLCNYTIANGRIFRGLVYIPIGMLLARISTKISRALVCSIFFGALILSQLCKNSFVIFYCQIAMSTAFFLFVADLHLPDLGIYKELRVLSAVIYFVHMYAWTFFYLIVYGEKKYGVTSFVSTSLISLLVAFGVLLKRNLNKSK